MPPRARWAVVAVLCAALGVAVVVAGQPGEPPPVAGVARLGPEAGEPVADYLRRAGASLPAARSGPPVWALVQLQGYLAPEPAAELTQGVRLSRVVLRVPLPRVQTALITSDLPGQRPAAELTEVLRSAAQGRTAVASREVPGGRPAAVATAEAEQLRAGCACVVALLVFGDSAALHAVASRPGVRVVHAAAPDTPLQDVAISPLLPEQIELAAPVPDDGAVAPDLVQESPGYR
ncbi:MAG TPA: hypothetical protein VJT72_11100 [Pseudonocardiaceae bacterium]|nr:hypothetical protein [Pseudonocardiaceae bacterium]